MMGKRGRITAGLFKNNFIGEDCIFLPARSNILNVYESALQGSSWLSL